MTAVCPDDDNNRRGNPTDEPPTVWRPLGTEGRGGEYHIRRAGGNFGALCWTGDPREMHAAFQCVRNFSRAMRRFTDLFAPDEDFPPEPVLLRCLPGGRAEYCFSPVAAGDYRIEQTSGDVQWLDDPTAHEPCLPPEVQFAISRNVENLQRKLRTRSVKATRRAPDSVKAPPRAPETDTDSVKASPARTSTDTVNPPTPTPHGSCADDEPLRRRRKLVTRRKLIDPDHTQTNAKRAARHARLLPLR